MMTTIDKVYCVPKTEEELKSLPFFTPKNTRSTLLRPVIKYEDEPFCTIACNGTGNREEVSVSKFLDIVHDRIAPWRLEEVGFVDPFKTTRRRFLAEFHTIDVDEQNVVRLDGGYTYITTFTELLTLIKFLTPPTNNA